MDNALLSTCHIKSVCDYLVAHDGFISNNASGCNSKEEIEDACETIGIPEISYLPEFIIYPNPANQELFVSCMSCGTIDKVTIYNQLGQEVLYEHLNTNSIDVSMLPSGLYTVMILSNTLNVRKKLIIE